MTRSSLHSKWTLTCLSIVASLLGCMLGCGESKKSLHEMDHVTPAHWPMDLDDAARKVSERLKAVQTGAADTQLDTTAAFKELRDLVSWVPEVAADTDLAEREWVKLYDASESLRKKLQDSKVLEASLAQEIETFCSLLVQSQSLIPPPLLPEVSEAEDATNTAEIAE